MTIMQLMTGSPGLSYETNGAVAYVESGALLTKLANSSISVDVTVADYVSVIGSPNYRLPIVVGSSSTNVVGSTLAHITDALPVGTNFVGYTGVVGSPNYFIPIVIGSASSIIIGSVAADIQKIGVALPAGTNLIGSVLGIKEAVSLNALPVGTNIIGSVAADIQKFGVALPAGTNIVGSVLVKIADQSGAVKIWDGTDYVGVEPQGALNVAVNEYYSTFGSNFAADQSNRMFLAGVVGSTIHLSNIFISSENNTTDVYLSFNSTAATAPVHVSHVSTTNKEITQTDRTCHIVGPTNGSLFCDCGSGTFVAVNYAYYT